MSPLYCGIVACNRLTAAFGFCNALNFCPFFFWFCSLSFSSFLCIAAQRKRTNEISSTTECPNSTGLPQTETGKKKFQIISMFVFCQNQLFSQSFCPQHLTARTLLNSISQYFTSLLLLAHCAKCSQNAAVLGSLGLRCLSVAFYISIFSFSAISSAHVVLTLFADSHLL